MSKSLDNRTPANSQTPAATLLSMANGLSPEALAVGEDLQKNTTRYSANEHIIRAGDRLERCYIVSEGWIARQHTSENGRTHITNTYLAGDFFSVHLGFLRWALYDFVALTDCRVSTISSQDLADAVAKSPELGAALDWSAVRTLNTVSEQAIGLALKPPSMRILHLLLEFWCRLMLVSKAHETGFHLPLTQAKIAEMCGLSIVSTNRAFRALRTSGLIKSDGRWIAFPDTRRAFADCGFDGRRAQPFAPSSITAYTKLSA